MSNYNYIITLIQELSTIIVINDNDLYVFNLIFYKIYKIIKKQFNNIYNTSVDF